MVRQKLKVFTGEAFLYGIGGGIRRLVGLVMLPILTRVFGPADYGAIDLLNVGFLFLALSLQVGAPAGFQRFYFSRAEGTERKKLVSSYLFMSSMVGLCFTGLVIAFNGPVAGLIPLDEAAVSAPELRHSVFILAWCIPLELFWNNAVLLLRMERRPLIFVAANLISVILTPTLTFWFVVHEARGVTGIYEAKLVATLLSCSATLWVTRSSWKCVPSLHEYLRQVRFGIPGHPGILMRSALNFLPHAILSYFAPLSAVGLFGIAARFCSPIRMFVQSFRLAWSPFAYANERTPEEARLYTVVFKSYLAILLLGSYTISLFAPELLRILAPGEFAGAAPLIPGVALFLGADGVTAIFGTAMYTRGRVAWDSYMSALRLVLFVVLALVLAPRWHAAGLVASLVASTILYLIPYSIRVNQIVPFHQSWRRLLTLVGLLFVGLQLAEGVRELDTAWRPVLLAATFVSTVGVAPLVILTRSEVRTVGKEWSRIRERS